MMHRVLIFIAVSALFICDLYANERDKIIMGAIHIPPYYVVSQSDGSIKGLIPQLLDSIFLPIDIEVQYKVLPIKRLKMELVNGTVDGFPLFFTEEDKEDKEDKESEFLLSEIYLSASSYIWAVSSKYPNGIQLDSFTDLKDYKIGIVQNASYGDKTNEFIANNSDIFYKSDSSPLNIKLLLSGRLDAIFSNEDVVLEHNINEVLVHSKKSLYTSNYRIFISSKSKFSSRIKEINKQIEILNIK